MEEATPGLVTSYWSQCRQIRREDANHWVLSKRILTRCFFKISLAIFTLYGQHTILCNK